MQVGVKGSAFYRPSIQVGAVTTTIHWNSEIMVMWDTAKAQACHPLMFSLCAALILHRKTGEKTYYRLLQFKVPSMKRIYLSVYSSHWCLVMSFWLKVCIYSHTRGVKLGLGLGFMQTSQVLPHWLNQSFSFWTLSYTQRHCHVRIEKGPVQTVAIILEAHNFLEYHYML